jgi:hypothetical protein
MWNTLALFEAVLKAARKEGSEDFLINDLERLGLRVGLTQNEVKDALHSDRMLVIYEP